MEGEAGGSAAVLREEALLSSHRGWGEIHVIVMRVLEAEHLVPHRVHLFRAVTPDFLDPRKVVDTGSLPEKLLCSGTARKFSTVLRFQIWSGSKIS